MIFEKMKTSVSSLVQEYIEKKLKSNWVITSWITLE